MSHWPFVRLMLRWRFSNSSSSFTIFPSCVSLRQTRQRSHYQISCCLLIPCVSFLFVCTFIFQFRFFCVGISFFFVFFLLRISFFFVHVSFFSCVCVVCVCFVLDFVLWVFRVCFYNVCVSFFYDVCFVFFILRCVMCMSPYFRVSVICLLFSSSMQILLLSMIHWILGQGVLTCPRRTRKRHSIERLHDVQSLSRLTNEMWKDR